MKQSKPNKLRTIALAVLLATGLSACAPVIVGSALVGSLVATDRRTPGAQLEDEGIKLRATSRVREVLVERANVSITSYNRHVLITGEVPNAQDIQLVEQIVQKVENVRGTFNELSVLGNTTLTQRSSDLLATGRVTAAFIDARDLYANAFKVVTERGTVYLLGRVTKRDSAALPATAPNHATQAPATSREQADPKPTSGRPYKRG
ncbi:MAG: BON domain-containing protein [Betaproteobacteria bacterium]|nr:BON domain-containing protein [Betaproteobacteria bacterium]